MTPGTSPEVIRSPSAALAQDQLRHQAGEDQQRKRRQRIHFPDGAGRIGLRERLHIFRKHAARRGADRRERCCAIRPGKGLVLGGPAVGKCRLARIERFTLRILPGQRRRVSARAAQFERSRIASVLPAAHEHALL